MQEDRNVERLEKIWKQGQRGVAVTFLRRVMQPGSNLAEIHEALQFAEVKELLSSIRLSEVTGAEIEPSTGATAAPASAGATQASKRSMRQRTRRGPAEMGQIKESLWHMLRDEPGSLDTTQLHESLAQLGHEIDRITLKRLLSLLESETKITCLGGRPKAWRRIIPAQARTN